MHKPIYTIKKNTLFGTLLVIFITAFVISPYWLTFNTNWGRFSALIILLITGGGWAYIAAASLKIKSIKKVELRYIFLLVLFGILINFFPLNSEFAFGGDEIHHAFQPIIIVSLLTKIQIVAVIFALAILIFILRKAKLFPIIILAILSALGAAIFFTFFLSNDIKTEFLKNLVRYPYFLSIIESIAPMGAKLFGFEHNTFLYRLVPFFSAILIGIFIFLYLRQLSYFIRLIISFTIISLPIIYFYSSILYLELPAIFLIIVVLFNSGKFLKDNFEKISTSYYWYALIIIGFMKETTIVFLFVLLAIRFFYQLSKEKAKYFNKKIIIDEIKIAFCVMFPIMLYVFFRGSNVRPFIPELSGLVSNQVYLNFVKYLWIQTGVLSLFAIVGLYFMYRRKDYSVFWVAITIILCYFLFFSIERGGIYVGLSRFNLFFAAILIFLSSYFFNSNILKKWHVIFGGGMLVLSNLIFCPIYIDGSRKLIWEIEKSSDLTYPYKKVFQYIKDKELKEVAFLQYRAFNYDRFYEFYSKKNSFKGHFYVYEYKNSSLKEEVLNLFGTCTVDIIVAQLLPGERFDSKLHIIKDFNYKIYTNNTNYLIVYKK